VSVFIGWGSAMEKGVGEVMWTEFGSNFSRRTLYPGLFVLFPIYFKQKPGHFVDLATAITYKCHLIIIIFDVVYVLRDAESVAK
jgi:hypothetical protein